METVARGEMETDSAEPPPSGSQVSWKATFGIIGIFCLGATLTQLVVVLAIYLGPRLLP